jgi:hypothetical protein
MKAATLSARIPGEGNLTVLDMIVDSHPRHRLVEFVLKCPVCSRKLWGHIEAISRKFGAAA